MFLDQLINFVDCMAELSAEKVRFLGDEPGLRHGGVARELINFEDCKVQFDIYSQLSFAERFSTFTSGTLATLKSTAQTY